MKNIRAQSIYIIVTSLSNAAAKQTLVTVTVSSILAKTELGVQMLSAAILQSGLGCSVQLRRLLTCA
jgi:hypothetical protein